MQTLWAPWRHTYVTGQDGGARPRGVPAALAGWPGPDTGCVFCNMLGAVHWATATGMPAEEAERAAGIVWWGTAVFVCLNAFPYSSGHIMVLPCAHLSRLMDVPRATGAEMMATAQDMEETLRSVYRPDGINVGINIGQAAGAGVADHLHLHMLPRWAGDTNFVTAIAETRVLPESLEVTWTRLRDALAAKATSSRP